MQYSINIKTLCLNFVSSENANSGLIYISLSTVDLHSADRCGFYIILLILYQVSTLLVGLYILVKCERRSVKFMLTVNLQAII